MPYGDLLTGRYQLQWRGQLLGWPETDLPISEVRGYKDLPGLRSNPVDGPGQHGEIPSQLLASGRVLEVDFADVDDDPDAFDALLDVIAPGDDDGMEPLIIWIDGTPRLFFGRVEKSAVPTDMAWSLGYRRATFQWRCADPRKYGLDPRADGTSLPTPGVGGLSFPLTFPLTFGTPATPNTCEVRNLGSVNAWPTLVITGPVTGPVVAASNGGKLRFDPTLTINPGDPLTIVQTPLQRSVMLQSGGDLRGALFQADWISLPPKGVPVTISFLSASGFDPAAGVSLSWYDTYL